MTALDGIGSIPLDSECFSNGVSGILMLSEDVDDPNSKRCVRVSFGEMLQTSGVSVDSANRDRSLVLVFKLDGLGSVDRVPENDLMHTR